MKHIIICIVLFLGSYGFSFGQNTLHITGGHLVQNDGYLVVKDATLTNDGTFSAIGGTVKMTGTETDANSAIGGTIAYNFYNLTIDKSSNNVLLNQPATISNNLNLLTGALDIQTNDLTITPAASITGYSTNSFVKTSSIGTLIRTVDASDIVFPIGKNSYTPATLNNAGTSDIFNARVDDEVLVDATSGNVVTSDNLDLTWYINETVAGGSDVSLTLGWNTSDELTGFDRMNCFVSHYNGMDWSANPAGMALGANPYTRMLANVSDFSPFTVTSNINVLPVELLSFTARKSGMNSQLDWVTASEINNDFFDVEWSLDGEYFERIGTVRGAGNTTLEQKYNHLHRNPNIGLNYYRLRQVDFDGAFEYSQIETVLFSKENMANLELSPNPTSSFVLIQTNHQGLFQIFDEAGRIIHEGNVNGALNLDISHLSAGLYFVKAGEMTKQLAVK